MRSSLHSLPLEPTPTRWLALCRPSVFGLVALIVLAETGGVFAPFLPGDSLRFVTGAAVAGGSVRQEPRRLDHDQHRSAVPPGGDAGSGAGTRKPQRHGL